MVGTEVEFTRLQVTMGCHNKPEIKYRRILNGAFVPGRWGLVPRGPHSIIGRTLTRQYGPLINPCLIFVARGEQDFFSPDVQRRASNLIPASHDSAFETVLVDNSYNIGVFITTTQNER